MTTSLLPIRALASAMLFCAATTFSAQPLIAQPAGKSIIPGEMPPIMQGAVQIGNLVNATATPAALAWIKSEATRIADSQQSEAQIESSVRESLIARFSGQPTNAVMQQVMYVAARLRAIEKQRQRDAESKAAQEELDQLVERLAALKESLTKLIELSNAIKATECKVVGCNDVQSELSKVLQYLADSKSPLKSFGRISVTPADINSSSGREAIAAELNKIAVQAKALRDAAAAKSTASKNALSAAYAVVSSATKAVDASGGREPALASIAKLF